MISCLIADVVNIKYYKQYNRDQVIAEQVAFPHIGTLTQVIKLIHTPCFLISVEAASDAILLEIFGSLNLFSFLSAK